MNPSIKRHLELEIKTLQNAPRDVDKLERLLRLKERQKEEAGAMTARNYVEYTSLTLVHNRLHFIIQIDEQTEKIMLNAIEPVKKNICVRLFTE
jgi:hypothetical protein